MRHCLRDFFSFPDSDNLSLPGSHLSIYVIIIFDHCLSYREVKDHCTNQLEGLETRLCIYIHSHKQHGCNFEHLPALHASGHLQTQVVTVRQCLDQ